jgi:glycosyltransferase involved in cell wall biosynthesis
MMARLSVVVIVKNGERTLDRCLRSVSFADEIVVLDSGSTDRTLEIARRHTEAVHVSTDWPGFGIQKNRALDLATGDWVLSIDADEYLSDQLAGEIRATVAAGPGDVYALPRLSSYCGRPMRHSGWWPDPVVRLFRRGSARFTDDLVHERLVFDGASIALTQVLHHESFADLDDVLDKVNRYSTAGARQAGQRGRRGGLGKAVVHGLWAFLRTYLLRAGFLDGREGFILAVSNAEGVYYRYLKLMYLQEKGPK